MVQLDGALLRSNGAELFGSASSDGAGALLDDIGDGSLLINQLDRVDPALLPALLTLARSGDWQAPGPGSTPRNFAGRLFFTTETALPGFDRCCTLIRVPPLRVRRQDLGEWLRYLLRLYSRKLGWAVSPVVGEEVIRRLQIHDFPGNVRELEGLVDRALRQMPASALASLEPVALPEEVFWLTPRPQRLRFDLWRWRPPLRQWMRSPRLWNGLLFGLVSWVFVLVNLWLWLGPQDRASNGGLNLFWAWWWPLILLSYPLVGRLWCSFCPFMVWGEIVQRLARLFGWQPAAWPRGNTDAWAAPALAAGFAAILLWEELAESGAHRLAEQLPAVADHGGSCDRLAALREALLVPLSLPVGGMNGLFAKLSILELRAEQGTCSGSCSTYACFKGGPPMGRAWPRRAARLAPTRLTSRTTATACSASPAPRPARIAPCN